MELLFKRHIEYQFKGAASAEDVIETLQANLSLTKQLRYLLQDLSPGLSIEDIRLSVEHVETGSLNSAGRDCAAGLQPTCRKVRNRKGRMAADRNQSRRHQGRKSS